jgi:hypothetical protein
MRCVVLEISVVRYVTGGHDVYVILIAPGSSPDIMDMFVAQTDALTRTNAAWQNTTGDKMTTLKFTSLDSVKVFFIILRYKSDIHVRICKTSLVC